MTVSIVKNNQLYSSRLTLFLSKWEKDSISDITITCFSPGQPRPDARFRLLLGRASHHRSRRQTWAGDQPKPASTAGCRPAPWLPPPFQHRRPFPRAPDQHAGPVTSESLGPIVYRKEPWNKSVNYWASISRIQKITWSYCKKKEHSDGKDLSQFFKKQTSKAKQNSIRGLIQCILYFASSFPSDVFVFTFCLIYLLQDKTVLSQCLQRQRILLLE